MQKGELRPESWVPRSGLHRIRQFKYSAGRDREGGREHEAPLGVTAPQINPTVTVTLREFRWSKGLSQLSKSPMVPVTTRVFCYRFGRRPPNPPIPPGPPGPCVVLNLLC